MILFIKDSSFDFSLLVNCTIATTKLSLISFANTKADEYLWEEFIKIKSINKDLSGYTRCGLVIQQSEKDSENGNTFLNPQTLVVTRAVTIP